MRYGSSLRSPQNAGAWSRTASGPGCRCTLHSAPGGYPLSSTVDHDGSCVVYVLSRPGCRILGTGRHLSSDITAPACSGPSSGLGCRLYRSIGASKTRSHLYAPHSPSLRSHRYWLDRDDSCVVRVPTPGCRRYRSIGARETRPPYSAFIRMARLSCVVRVLIGARLSVHS